MNLKQYQNEIIALAALLLMLIAFAYKSNQVSAGTGEISEAKSTLSDLRQVIALQKIWADKKTSKKVENLKTLISPSRVKWSENSNKLTATFSNLTPNELNALVTKVLNLAVVIDKLEVQKSGLTYGVEFKCKW